MTAARARLTSLVGELHNPAFRKLWLSQVVSEVGDWAARLALTVIVFRRTDSAAWSALVAVSAMLPMLGPGQLLATLADRLDRRFILVTADAVRAVVFGLLVFASPPTWVLLALSVLAGVATVPFEAARSAATLDVTPPDRLSAAMSLGQATQSLALVLGWGVGGVLLATIGARGSLAVNACTFVVSAAFLVQLPPLRSRVDASDGDDGPAAMTAVERLFAAVSAVTSDTLVRRAALLAVLAVGPVTACETLIVPFVAKTWAGAPSIAAALLAAGSAGDLLLTVAVSRSAAPERLMRTAAWCCAAPAALAVVLFSFDSPPLAAAGFVVSALCLTTIAPASASLAPRLPVALRASCYTVLMTALTLTQVGLSAGGGFATDAIGAANVARLLMVLPLGAGVLALVRMRSRSRRVAQVHVMPELAPAMAAERSA